MTVMSHQCNYCNKLWSFKNDVYTLECEAVEKAWCYMSIFIGVAPLQYGYMPELMPLTFFELEF